MSKNKIQKAILNIKRLLLQNDKCTYNTPALPADLFVPNKRF